MKNMSALDVEQKGAKENSFIEISTKPTKSNPKSAAEFFLLSRQAQFGESHDSTHDDTPRRPSATSRFSAPFR